MSGMYRSAEMSYCSILMPHEISSQAVRVIGHAGCLHIVDLGDKMAPSKDALVAKKRMQDCVYWERKLEHFEEQMKEFKVDFPRIDGTDMHLASGNVLEEIEKDINPIEEELVMNITFQRDQKRTICALVEHLHVLHVAREQHLQDRVKNMEDSSPRSEEREHDFSAPLLQSSYRSSPAEDSHVRFRTIICGTITQSQQALFQRMLYRISRGNAISEFTVIEGGVESALGERVAKSVFVVMLIGTQLHKRITKMCTLFEAAVYDVPHSAADFDHLLYGLPKELDEKRDVLGRTERAVESLLRRLAFRGDGSSPLRDWQLALHKEAEVAKTLMQGHFYTTMLCIEGWCCLTDVNRLRDSLSQFVRNTKRPLQFEVDPGHALKRPKQPPTYFKINKFTAPFQVIVDTYGVGRYQEANPALFTIITFPFLFGVMYGDVGHGTLLTLFAIFMIVNEKKYLKQQEDGTINEMFGMAFSGRYMMVLMGFFGVYVGSLYNDCMAMPLPLFDSMWFVNETSNQYQRVEGRVYPWGADWAWYNKKNQLFFFNSFKMKLSVILGVTQMMFGLCLSLSNALFFKDYAAVWLEFVPQVIFLMCTFGYMIIIIFYKWCVDWTQTTAAAPNLVQTMIGMFLRPGSVDEDKQLYSGQGGIQLTLLLCALLAVPVMLFGKPYSMKWAREKAAKAAHRPRFASYSHMADGDAEMEEMGMEEAQAGGGGGESHEEHSFGDDMIHQFIHTIEFVLGCVSNTASYLRLWALSLAHAQLAQVFWDRMMMQYGINTGNPVMAFIGFGAWACATFFVLLCMDVLECFLHALRLHWVEFQNKFYRADGYPADFFSFTKSRKDD